MQNNLLYVFAMNCVSYNLRIFLVMRCRSLKKDDELSEGKGRCGDSAREGEASERMGSETERRVGDDPNGRESRREVFTHGKFALSVVFGQQVCLILVFSSSFESEPETRRNHYLGLVVDNALELPLTQRKVTDLIPVEWFLSVW